MMAHELLVCLGKRDAERKIIELSKHYSGDG